MKKRLLSTLLALCMVLTLLPGTVFAATAPTEQQAYAAMNALRSKYPEGMTWTNDNSYAWKGGIYSVGYGCAGFAFLLSDAAFGDLPARRLTGFEFSDIRVGDILRMNNDTHSVIVLEVHDSGVTIAEGNYNNSIHWGRTLTKAEVLSANYVLTRYPLAQEDPPATPTTPTTPDTKTGSCGANVTWSYSNGVLTIQGKGPMDSYIDSYNTPWRDYSDEIHTVIIGDGVTNIGGNVFSYYSKLASVTIPKSVTTIETGAFFRCTSLASVVIPSSVTGIGYQAFSDTPWQKSLGQFAVANGIMFAYQGNGGNVTIPSGVTTINEMAFYGCTGLVSVTIPQSVTSIKSKAFDGCENLTSVTIPKSVVAIGDYAFDHCTSLTSIHFGGSESQWKQIFNDDNYYYPLTSAKITYGGATAGPDESEDPTESTEPAKPGTPTEPGTPSEPTEPGTPAAPSFTDVPAGEYYADAVAWAVANGVTSGTGNGRFSPGDPCTRAQIVTFLWRAYGRQEPTSTVNPFTDVKSGDYYYKAVLWAVENGITGGITDTTFGPNNPCTRAQAVTFQYRAASKPDVTGGSSFTDVPADAYYTNAVVWAVANGVTSGTSTTTFSPDQTCTRGQIVTFLYRDLSED